MSTTAPAPNNPQTATPPAKANPIRLVILLGLLAVVVVMLLVDQMVFKPGALAAQERLKEVTDAKMKMGVVKENGEEAAKVSSLEHYTTADEVYKAVGRKPSWKREEGNHVIETFAWWGYIPFDRHRFDVMYRKGKDGTLIYESQDGHLTFEDVKNIEAKPAEIVDLKTRPNDPANTEGGEGNTAPLDETVPPPSTDATNPPSSETNPATPEEPATPKPDTTEAPASDAAEATSTDDK